MGSVFAGAKILEATLRRAFGLRRLLMCSYCSVRLLLAVV